ncbi:MAG: hypothetical protein JXA67_17450 [Micromonosporaceae bacterium]|nr:hypothetical protein [Micromonosporaceae bacterium]
MKLTVSSEVRERYPQLRIAVLVAQGIDNTGVNQELEERKRAAAARMHGDLTYESLATLPEIEAWRQAYRSFGVKPKDSRPTAEAFLRRLVKGEEFPTISKAVDTYLLVETEFYLPVGGYDLATLSGDITLRRSEGGEEFVPLGGRTAEVTRPGEIVYADERRVLTRKWNYRDCDHCKVTTSSTAIALFTEDPYAVVPVQRLRQSVELMADLLGKYCGGSISTGLLDCATTGEFTF